MAQREFLLPDLGEGLTEGEILRWLVAEGETVAQNQPVVEVETAKAAVEIPAKWPGTITKIFYPEGSSVPVGAPIVTIDTESVPVLVGYGPTAGPGRRVRRGTSPVKSPEMQVAAPRPDDVVESDGRHGPALAKPPVRKLARDMGIDLRAVTGTGPAGSITRADVQAAAAVPAAPNAARERRIPVRGVRKLTAENVASSARMVPHATEFLTIDITRSMRALRRLRKRSDWQGLRTSPLLLVAKAVLLALKRHPMVNASWDETADEIVVKDYVNLGIAAATERGLVVPNIKDAGRLSMRELAEALTSLVQAARAGRSAPADMSGGTFTITNVGVFGIDSGTPILPPGEAAILAFGAVQERPWVHQGKIKVRQVTTLGLSFDHRIIDGELGSRYLSDIGEFLTDPEAALLAWG